jgi:hypothetical protein
MRTERFTIVQSLGIGDIEHVPVVVEIACQLQVVA